jgi:hypothetical protein
MASISSVYGLTKAFYVDLDAARRSRERTGQHAATLERRKARKLERKREKKQAKFDAQRAEALRNGVQVRQLPAGPKFQKKEDKRKPTWGEIFSLRNAIKELQAEVTRLKTARGNASFYDSPEWHKIRYEALRRSNGHCELCGASKADGVIIQVDHIKPRSKYPELALEPSNLQVLCRPCNMGKSNTDQIDWRKPKLKVVSGN